MSTRTVYIKTALVGGANTAVDGIDGDDLLDGDVCHAFVSDVLYAYLLDDDSGAAESSPDIISPDANAGDKRWILQNAYGLAAKAASGANSDITSMTGLDDGGIPVAKVDGAMKDDGSNLAIGSDADGDMYYRASSVLARLAKGTANFNMFMNAAGTAPEWASGRKMGTTTYDTATDSGDQSITGVGFKPSLVLLIVGVNATAQISFGIDNGTAHYHAGFSAPDGNTWYIETDRSIWLYQASGVYLSGLVSALGTDGFTITWTKTGAKTGTAIINYIAFR